MDTDYRFNNAFIKLYLSTPENKTINNLVQSTTKTIVENYFSLTKEDLYWLEDFLSCTISIKKIMDIPKQLNIFLYKDQLPSIRDEFLTLQQSVPNQYKEILMELQKAIEKGLNLIITDEQPTSEPISSNPVDSNTPENYTGFHLRRYRTR